MKKIALMLFCTIILSSCEKEKQWIVENTDIPLISKVLIDGVLYLEYTYNKANLLSEEKNQVRYTKHSYNDNNLLTTSEFYIDPAMFSSSSSVIEASMNRLEWVNPGNTAKSLTQKFEYSIDGLLARKTYTRPSVTDSEFTEYSFENDRISRQKIYYKNVMSYYIDYVYDTKGNLIKQSKYYVSSDGTTELLTTNEYEYDNMHNPYLAFKRLMSPGKHTNSNNITKETYTIHFEVYHSVQKVQITSYTYEYNSRGYPTKVNGEAEYVYR